MKEQTILVTGGLGYIGSHTTVELLNEGFKVIIVDDLSNSELSMLEGIKQITSKHPVFYQLNLCDAPALEEIFQLYPVDVVIHFAAFKSVNESAKHPLKYFQNNLLSLMNVLQSMQGNKVRNLIFSSSATVYGQPTQLPVDEQTCFQKALSAYGSTKQMGEEIIEKLTDTGKLQSIALRYFNPVGAHPSSRIGELPRGVPSNLFPFVTQTAIGKLKSLTVFGNDHPTPDGTCLRDFIHVVDLAKAHVQSCKRLLENKNTSGFEIFNIGTGKATSVMDIINAFEKTTGIKLNYRIGRRRAGDAVEVYADATKANQILGWKATYSLHDMILSAWQWEKALAKQTVPPVSL